ncbi:MAG: hypothetical protein WBF75_19825 [Pseudonocardiaceae bacterium]
MTEHTEAAEQRQEQAPTGSVPAPDLGETLTPGHGMPRPLCMTNHRAANPPPTSSPHEGIHGETDPLVAGVCYQAWGWPVTVCGHQVWLTLEPDTVALAIPVLLAAQVTGILNHHRPPPTLIHPETPEHWVLLAGRCAEGALPWPAWVHRATGTLALPPTMTEHGPITWTHPPEADARRLCREFDVFAALRTALRDQPT